MDVYDSIKVILFENFKASLEGVVFPGKLKIAKFQFFKKVIKKIFKTTDQFLFFQFLPKCLNVLCMIVYMSISSVTIFFTKINLVFK